MSWSHYRLIIRIEDPEKRNFYVRSAVEERWTVRQLDRQIHSFYYERLLATRTKGKDKVRQEIQQLEPPTKADGILKDPYVLDFLDLNGTSDYLETDLEQALMDKLQQFLLELGSDRAKTKPLPSVQIEPEGQPSVIAMSWRRKSARDAVVPKIAVKARRCGFSM